MPWTVRLVPFLAPDSDDAVAVAAFELGSTDDMLAVLSPRPISRPEWFTRAGLRRQAEFLAGRRACAVSLAACGCPAPDAVGRNADGSPSWPDGFVGSVTHGGGLAAAVAARRSRYLGLGIDAEYLLSPEGEADVRSTIASPRELARLESSTAPAVHRALSTLVFSAKESLFKCLYPLVGTPFEFDVAEIIELAVMPDGTGDFRVRLVQPLGERFSAGWERVGRFAVKATHVQTAIGLRA